MKGSKGYKSFDTTGHSTIEQTEIIEQITHDQICIVPYPAYREEQNSNMDRISNPNCTMWRQTQARITGKRMPHRGTVIDIECTQTNIVENAGPAERLWANKRKTNNCNAQMSTPPFKCQSHRTQSEDYQKRQSIVQYITANAIMQHINNTSQNMYSTILGQWRDTGRIGLRPRTEFLAANYA